MPLLPGTLDYSKQGFCAGGLTSNREFFGKKVFISESVSAETANVFFDPQTSGGLLIFCQSENAGNLLASLQASNIPAVEIGVSTREREHLLTLT